MLLAILNMVVLISFAMSLAARQNFRFNPSSILVPGGGWFDLHRLWNVRFLGCRHKGEAAVVSAMLKFFCRLKVGFAQNPKLVRQSVSVCRKRFNVCVVYCFFIVFCLVYLFFLR
jgi:hypothetical protein